MNETEQFLKSLDDEQVSIEDIFNHPLVTEPEKEPEPEVKEEEEDGFKPMNRRERRRQEKIDRERNANIQLAERISKLETAKQAITEDSDYLKGIEQIYGTDSPEARMATELLQKAIVGARDDAENRAYERIQSERQRETQATAEAEAELDAILDEIEESYSIDLTEAQETAYFQLLQKMSPKDRNGNVTSLADPHAVFEIFQEKLTKGTTDNRAKELSARSMTQSVTPKESTLETDTLERYLKENGII